MTNVELRELFENSMRRSRELEAKYRRGERLSRREFNEMRHCTQRVGVVARELWIAAGQPEGEEFSDVQQPIRLTPLPVSLRALDLTGGITREVH